MRIPPSLHRKLREAADSEGISLNRFCESHLAHSLRAEAPEAPANWQALRDFTRKTWGESLKGLVLFGSRARQQASTSSDVDLLVVLDKRIPITRRLYRQWDTRPADLGSDILSVHFVRLPRRAEDAGGLWYEVSIDGIVLDDREWEVSRFLRQIREATAQGELQRRTSHGHPYWIRAFEKKGAA